MSATPDTTWSCDGLADRTWARASQLEWTKPSHHPNTARSHDGVVAPSTKSREDYRIQGHGAIRIDLDIDKLELDLLAARPAPDCP